MIGTGERGFFGRFRRVAEKSGMRLLTWPVESRRGTEDVIKSFNLPPGLEEELEDHQKKILDNLVEAAKGFASVFAAQDASDELSFYPHGATAEQITSAAEQNPDADIRSPYTVVETDADGNWSSKPMHQVYATLIKENRVREYLRQAASYATKGQDEDQALRIFLTAREQALETGDYKKSEEFWVTLNDEPKVSIQIGFYDTYTDTLMGEKFAAQAWVDILDEPKTDLAKKHIEIFQNWRRKKTHRRQQKVRARAAHTKIMVGQAARYNWSANSYPPQEEWREEMGSKIHIFLTSFEKNAERRIPVMKQLGILYDVPDEIIKDMEYERLIFHEVAHSEVPMGIKTRLGSHAQPIKELYCDLLALNAINDIYAENNVKRDITLLSVFAQGLLGYIDYLHEGKNAEYYVGRSTILGFCVEKGSIIVNQNGITWDDTDKVFQDLAQLLELVKTIQANGTINSTRNFFDSHFHPDIYNALVPLINTPPDFLRKEEDSSQSLAL